MIRASFRVAKAVAKPDGTRIVWIEDCDGHVSVTNDAEAVCRHLQHDFPGYRIIYRDTDGNWDELVHRDGVFERYAPARDCLPPGAKSEES